MGVPSPLGARRYEECKQKLARQQEQEEALLGRAAPPVPSPPCRARRRPELGPCRPSSAVYLAFTHPECMF
eukprot:1745285-Pyramimonas_sp.AAC.1